MKHRPSQQTLIEHTIKSKIKTKSKGSQSKVPE